MRGRGVASWVVAVGVSIRVLRVARARRRTEARRKAPGAGVFSLHSLSRANAAFGRTDDVSSGFAAAAGKTCFSAFATARNPHRAAHSPVPSTHAASFERPREAFRALSRSRFTGPATSRARNPRRPLSAKDAFSFIGAESDKLAQPCSPRRPASTRRRRAASRLVRAERRAPLAARRVSASATRAASSTSPCLLYTSPSPRD